MNSRGPTSRCLHFSPGARVRRGGGKMPVTGHRFDFSPGAPVRRSGGKILTNLVSTASE